MAPARSPILLAALLAVSSTACLRTLDLEAPSPAPGTEAILLLFERLAPKGSTGASPCEDAPANEPCFAMAVSVKDGVAEYPDLTLLRDDYRVWSLEYTCPREVVMSSATAGLVPFVESAAPVPSRRPPDEAARVSLTSVEAGARTPWAAATTGDLERLRHFWLDLPPRERCDGYEIRGIIHHDLGMTGFGSLGLELTAAEGQPGTALVTTHFDTTGTFYEERARASLLVGLSTTTPNLAGFRDASGDLWLVGYDGRVVFGRPGFGFSEAPSLSPPSAGAAPWIGEAVVLSGDPASPSPELFALPDDGVLRRFDGARWESLLSVWSSPPATAPWDAGRRVFDVAWTAPGAAAVFVDEAGVFRYRGGALERDVSQPADATAIAFVPGLGLVVGTAGGKIALDGRALDPGLTAAVTRILPRGAGFIAGFADGEVAVYTPANGFCAVDASVFGPVEEIAGAGDLGFVVLSKTGADPQVGAYVAVTPRAVHGCSGAP